MLGNTVQAVSHLGGNWTYGKQKPGNGYEFHYSYYDHYQSDHWAKVYQNGDSWTKSAKAGATAMVHSPSIESWKVFQSSYQAGK